jgi:hypothetical protein
MNLAATQIYAKTVANGEAIAGIRVDMAAMQAAMHADVVALRAALLMQGDSLREQIGVTAAAIRSDMTAFREATDQRFERADMNVRIQLTELRGELTDLVHSEVTGLRGEMNDRFAAVDARFTGVDKRFNSVDERFDAVEDRFNEVDERFDGVDRRFDALDAKIDTIIDEIRATKSTS